MKRKRSRKPGRRAVLVGVVLASMTAAGAVAAALLVPYAGFDRPVFVDIPKGTGTRAMGRLLAKQGVVRSGWQFLLVRAVRPRVALQAGEYRFAGPSSAWEVFDRIARGDVFYYEVPVPEGYNIFDIAGAVDALGIITRSQFLAAARDPSTIRDLAPSAPSLEGYLFPSTYRITRQTSGADFCRQMTEQFRRVWKEMGAPAGADVHHAVTLASLVEKETAVPPERAVVASVYHNRLRMGMRLECDPTAIYAALLEGRYRGSIYRSDLERDHPYNTYRRTGLPPGPIANPSRASLEAALRPARTDFLYFVALPGNSGGHAFSRSLAAHHRAVERYRRGQ